MNQEDWFITQGVVTTLINGGDSYIGAGSGG